MADKIRLLHADEIEHMMAVVDDTPPDVFEAWAQAHPDDYNQLCNELIDFMRVVDGKRRQSIQ